MSTLLREEFHYLNFGFCYSQPDVFVHSQWRWPHELYIAWRTFWAVWHTFWTLKSVMVELDISQYTWAVFKWLIYLTNISYLVLSVQSTIHLVIIVCYWRKGKTQSSVADETCWYNRVLWLLTSLGFDMAIAASFLYWTLVFKELRYIHSVMTHAVSSVYVVSDLFVTATPVRILHVVYSMIYGLIYFIFTVVYHVLGGTDRFSNPYIYKALNWARPRTAAVVSFVSVLVVLPLVHLLQFGLFRLRVCIFKTCTCYSCRDDGGSDRHHRKKPSQAMRNSSKERII